ncbi:hypothetical protein V1525DRAFT_231081 [Lipomyces kononenkoae]|uniref:Uncharacterized protein n=1 Tax=Lipomyces kononenkoae TaxID=34357 RepID=A0ACC3SX13_LIPKO
MKWGGSSKQQTPSSSGRTRKYGDLAGHNSAMASQNVLLASSSYLPLTTDNSNSRGEEETIQRIGRPIRLFKHQKHSESDDQQSVSVASITSSPTNPPSPLFPAFRSYKDDNLDQHMTLSRSMNDIGTLSSSSPSTREILGDYDHTGRDDLRQKSVGAADTKKSAQVTEHPGYKQGWLNRSDVDPKKANRLPVWKLQRAILKDNYLLLYKPPSDMGVKFFDFSSSFRKLNITDSEMSHQSLERHPGLKIDEDGNIVSGTVEAICHELLYGDDQDFAYDVLLLLPIWTDFVHAMEIVAKLSILGDASERITFILNTIADRMSSALLDDAAYSVFKTLSGQLGTKDRVSMERRMADKKSQLLGLLNYASFSSGDRRPDLDADTKYSQLNLDLKDFSVDAFLNIDIDLFAAQIHIFNLRLYRTWNPVDDFSLLYALKYIFARKNPLVSTIMLPHFLGTTMIKQLFGTGSTGHNSPASMSELLSRWILLGNILKQRGDMVGWLAIASIVCSPALCRLKEIWSLLSSDSVDIVNRDWAPVIFDVDRRLILSELSSRRESSHILAPDGIGKVYSKDWVVPYFGDISIHLFERMSEINKGAIDITSSRNELVRIHKTLERWTLYIASVEDAENLPILEAPDSTVQECLCSLYEAHMSAPPISPLAIMEMSLSYEPPITGQYAQHYTSHRSPLSTGSYSAILFTEVLPSYKLFAQKDLLEAGGLLYKKSSSSLKSKTSADPLVPQGNHLSDTGTKQLRRASSFPPSRANMTITGYSDLDTTSRNRVAGFPNRHFLVKSVRDVLNMGVNLYHIRSELVLKSFKDDGARASRLSSIIFENPSKRMSNGSRRLSAQFQPAALELQIPDRPSQLQPVNVVAKAGTFDRLVDILVVGVEDFSSIANTDDASNLQKSGHTSFHMNMDVFTSTFLATYRNFASSSGLLDSLRRRFLCARGASMALHTGNKASIEFPDWNGFLDETEDGVDWIFVAKVHIGILEACNLWVSEYYSDLLNELHLRESFLEFLHIIDKEACLWTERRITDENLTAFADTIEMQSRKLRKSFARKSYRPIDTSPWPVVPVLSPSPLKFPECNIQSIAQFCDSVDTIVAIIFQQIKMKDWLVVYEVFEMQTVDPHKLFTNRNLTINTDDDIIIQDVFGFCASLHCLKSDELMISHFPKAIKKLYAFRMNLVLWVAIHIADPFLKKSLRVKRMVAMLRAIAICRKRMSVIEFGPQMKTDDDEPMEDDAEMKIPSLIESAIASAIVRPESRQYAAAWAEAAREVGKDIQQVNFLEDIIPKFVADDNMAEHNESWEPLTICMGWIFERILEIVCYVPNMAVSNPSMVNFDKQRYIYNFLSNVLDTQPSKRSNISVSEEPAAMLFKLDMTNGFDKRQVKEAAAREMREWSQKGSKALRAFAGLVAQEQEKLRRDARQKEALDRHVRDQTKGGYNRSRAPIQSADKKYSKSSRFGGLLRAVRPLSMAFSNNSSPPLPDRSVSPLDLPEISSIESRHKPAISINLASAMTIIPSDMQRMGVFKVVCDDGSDYLFQATNDDDLDEWVKLCSAVRASAIEKSRVTRDVLEPADSRFNVFGVPIEVVCKRENQSIPTVVQLLLAEIEARGLEEVGIYRVPGSMANVNELKKAFDSGSTVNMNDERWYDINTVAGCLKLYLRELPEPLLTEELFPEFTRIAKIADEHEQVALFSRAVESLPSNNFYLLRRIIGHLAIISSHGDINKMHAVNLAIVFSMSLLPGNNPFSMSSDLGSIQTMLRTMIVYSSQIFTDNYNPGARRSGESLLAPPPVPEKETTVRPVQGSHAFDKPSKRESYQEVSVF